MPWFLDLEIPTILPEWNRQPNHSHFPRSKASEPSACIADACPASHLDPESQIRDVFITQPPPKLCGEQISPLRKHSRLTNLKNNLSSSFPSVLQCIFGTSIHNRGYGSVSERRASSGISRGSLTDGILPFVRTSHLRLLAKFSTLLLLDAVPFARTVCSRTPRAR